MRPLVVNGDVWSIRRVPPGDPSLVDRTGHLRLATTDPSEMTINISSEVVPPMLDKVLLHEAAHAITISHGLLRPLRAVIPPELWTLVEEWSAELMEKHGIEAIIISSESLGRPLCVHGLCLG